LLGLRRCDLSRRGQWSASLCRRGRTRIVAEARSERLGSHGRRFRFRVANAPGRTPIRVRGAERAFGVASVAATASSRPNRTESHGLGTEAGGTSDPDGTDASNGPAACGPNGTDAPSGPAVSGSVITTASHGTTATGGSATTSSSFADAG